MLVYSNRPKTCHLSDFLRKVQPLSGVKKSTRSWICCSVVSGGRGGIADFGSPAFIPRTTFNNWSRESLAPTSVSDGPTDLPLPAMLWQVSQLWAVNITFPGGELWTA